MKRPIAVATNFLNRNTGFLILVSVIMFGFIAYAQSQDIKRQGRDIERTVETTATIVEKQDETLAAIQRVALDNKLISDQKTNIIICMLQIPQPERLPAEQNCRKQIESTSTSPTPSAAPSVASRQSSPASSSPQSAPSGNNQQQNNSQPDNDGVIVDLPLLPKLHIPSPL